MCIRDSRNTGDRAAGEVLAREVEVVVTRVVMVAQVAGGSKDSHAAATGCVEVNGDDAKKLVANGVIAVSAGANMPSTPEAIKVCQDAKILYAPGKAANAGGVSVSGLEMTQNSIKPVSYTHLEFQERYLLPGRYAD